MAQEEQLSPAKQLARFEERVRLLAQGNNAGFATEFGKLFRETMCGGTERLQFASYEEYLASKLKNRYDDIVPAPSSIVTLSPMEGVPASWYINANYISSVCGDEKPYIATQGPLPNTVADFWRLVWEQNCQIVVMLARTEEKGMVKCHVYWPSVGQVGVFNAEGLRLECMAEKRGAGDWVEREFKLSKGGTSRTIVQFHFLMWPDYGVPETTDCFAKLKDAVDDRVGFASAQDDNLGPVLVHCSAGIGRTGVYCAVDQTLKKLQTALALDPTEPAPPIFDLDATIRHLRSQRAGMVQTEEQYVFCHYAILAEAKKLTEGLPT